MPDTATEPALARIDRVELARVGTWNTMTGTWTATAEDLHAAVDAAQCPATRRPIIKLGHLDQRFTPHDQMPTFDGTPSIGWLENLAVDGDVLVGDMVGVPAWLKTVAASAYPNRSVEGAYNRRCAAGHTHPFTIAAVSLLGVTPPGVDTLRSLNDIPALFGLAASGVEDLDAGQAVVATLPAPVAAADEPRHTGAMVALIPTAEDAARLAVDGGEPVDQLHCTLLFLGDATNLDAAARQQIIDVVSEAVRGMPIVDADAFAASLFNPGGDDPCVVLGLSGPELGIVYDLVSDAVDDVDIPEQHDPWIPYLTLTYTGDPGRVVDAVARVGPVRFDRLRVVFAAQAVDIPLLPEPVDDEDPDMVAAAAGDENTLRDYWVFGKGRGKWRRWTELYRRIKKYVGAARAKRIAAAWFHLRYGYWPGDRRNRDQVAAAAPPQPDDPHTTPPDSGGVSVSGAEPEPTTEPKEGDLVSTLSTDVRSRLGLTDTDDDAAVLAAIDNLKVKADTPAPAPEPDPQAVAAAAAHAQENEQLRKEISVLASQMQQVTTELAAAKAQQAAATKASVLDAAQSAGKFAPAQRAQWEADYDEAPGAVARILGAIAPGTAVPVAASGYTGSGDEGAPDEDAEYARIVAEIDGPYATSSKGA